MPGSNIRLTDHSGKWQFHPTCKRYQINYRVQFQNQVILNTVNLKQAGGGHRKKNFRLSSDPAVRNNNALNTEFVYVISNRHYVMVWVQDGKIIVITKQNNMAHHVAI